MFVSMESDDRLRVRRGSEHVRIKGTTEELGEIVPGPVRTETGPGSEDEDAEPIVIDDGEQIGR
jgi:hypothetical protein